MNEFSLPSKGLLSPFSHTPEYIENLEAMFEELRLLQIDDIIRQQFGATEVKPSLFMLGGSIVEKKYLVSLIEYARKHSISLSSPNWRNIVEGKIARKFIDGQNAKRKRGGQKRYRFGLLGGPHLPPLLAEVENTKAEYLNSTGQKLSDAKVVEQIVMRAHFAGINSDDIDYGELEPLVNRKKVLLSKQRRQSGKTIGKVGLQRRRLKTLTLNPTIRS